MRLKNDAYNVFMAFLSDALQKNYQQHPDSRQIV